MKPYILTTFKSVYASHLLTYQNVYVFPETSYVGKYGGWNTNLKAKCDAEFSSYIKKSTA